MIWKTRTGSARKYLLSLSHLQQTCLHNLFCHFIAFLEFADWQQNRHQVLLLGFSNGSRLLLCVCVGVAASWSYSGKDNLESQGHWISYSCAGKANRHSYCFHPFHPVLIKIVGRTSWQDMQKTCVPKLVLCWGAFCTDPSKSTNIEWIILPAEKIILKINSATISSGS